MKEYILSNVFLRDCLLEAVEEFCIIPSEVYLDEKLMNQVKSKASELADEYHGKDSHEVLMALSDTDLFESTMTKACKIFYDEDNGYEEELEVEEEFYEYE